MFLKAKHTTKRIAEPNWIRSSLGVADEMKKKQKGHDKKHERAVLTEAVNHFYAHIHSSHTRSALLAARISIRLVNNEPGFSPLRSSTRTSDRRDAKTTEAEISASAENTILARALEAVTM